MMSYDHRPDISVARMSDSYRLHGDPNGFSAQSTRSAQLPTPWSSKHTSPSPSHSPNTKAQAPPFTAIQPDQAQHMWIVTGPAGCGKTTTAQYLASQLSLPYVEGDDFHSPTNKAKMAAGIPLTDEDRWDWLVALRDEAIRQLTTTTATISYSGPPSPATTAAEEQQRRRNNDNNHHQATHHGVIVTCSALKHKYRDVLRVSTYTHPEIQVHFVYLKATESIVLERVAARQDHYMKASMVHSQFANLEEPDDDEAEGDVLVVDVSDGAADVVRDRALQVVRAKLSEYAAGTGAAVGTGYC